jgi:hypothetical protein
MQPATRTTRSQPTQTSFPIGNPLRRRGTSPAAPLASKPKFPLNEKYILPGRISHSLLLPTLPGNQARRVMEPEPQPSAFLPSHERPHFAGDRANHEPSFSLSALTDEALAELHREYTLRKVNGLIYDPEFFEKERARAKFEPTVVIDLDKTLAIRSSKHDDRLYDLHRRDDEEPTEAWLVRPGFDDELTALVKDGPSLALWTGGNNLRTWDFFQNRADLLKLFRLIITEENYFAFYLERLASRRPLDAEPMTILGVDVAELTRKMRIYHPSFSPKLISLLGYHVIADDHDGLQLIGKDNPFGPFETVPVSPFTHDLPMQRDSALYEKYRRESAAIAQDIRAALRRQGFAIP